MLRGSRKAGAYDSGVGRGPRTASWLSFFLALGLTGALPARAQTPPNTPTITAPAFDGQILNPFDVHMETSPFSDPDAGDTHFCTDWEIWTVSPSERVWVTACITGLEKLHTHLADGVFEGSHTGQTALNYDTDYLFQARHRDNTGLWSAWAQRPFSTGSLTQVYPLLLDDVAAAPAPTWRDESNATIILLAGSPAPKLRFESGAAALLLQIAGFDGVSNAVINPAGLGSDVAPRIVLEGGSTGLVLPASRLAFTDGGAAARTVYLPAINLPPSTVAYYWVSANGSTYVGSAVQTDPDFSVLARGSPVPWTVYEPGFEVEVAATGFQLPVNIAFVPNPGPNPGDPYYYVTELYGTIKVVTRNGTVSDYVSGLLNFDPTGAFPGSGEQGLAGIVVDPASGDVFCGYLYDSAPPDGPHYPKVVRFHSNDGGLTAATETTVLDMPGEEQGQSHFISNFSIGPDGKLYVHMGDGFDATTALNLSSYRGKILRMNLNGTAPSDNPFYNAGNGINARDYVFAYGFRNPFGGAWRSADGFHYEVENGNSVNDRLAKVTAGTSYGWNGTDTSMLTNAIYTWVGTVGPVNMAWIQPSTFGGSRFPASKQDHAFVTQSGATWATGPNENKSITEFVITAGGSYVSGPTPIAQYNGVGKASAVGLTAGPDGLYFTDLYKDLDYVTPIDPGANVLRLLFRGIPDFTSNATFGSPPLTVQFTDLSNVPDAASWQWDFGDGFTSTAQNPSHLYGASGVYDVRLSVTGSNGTVVKEKTGYIVVGPFRSGLRAEYYNDLNFTPLTLIRYDPTVDFDWGNGSPDAMLGGDTFTVRWTGQVRPTYSQLYTFYAATDDGVRVWMNNQALIDEWIDQGLTEHSGTIALTGGQWYDIRMEYFENGGLAQAFLSWESASQPKQIVPMASLRATDPASAVEGVLAPEIFRVTLMPASPNPFHRDASLAFAVPTSGWATLRVYDVRGTRLATLFDGPAEGRHLYRIPFRAEGLPAGVYVQELEAAGQRISRKLLLLR